MRNRQRAKGMQRAARAKRIRSGLSYSADQPRLSVFRSLKHIRGQIIAPGGRVVVAVSDEHVENTKLRGVERARATGELLAKRARDKKVVRVVFDKGPYAYHGRVKAFAEGARAGGLQF